MTSQGTASGRFQRALARRSVFQAEMAAREMGQVSLQNALELVLLYAEDEPAKFDRAATRWLERLTSERALTPVAAAFAAASLAAAVDPLCAHAAVDALRRLAASTPRRRAAR